MPFSQVSGQEQEELRNSDWKTIIVHWLCRQPAPTVLLFIIIGLIGYGAWYGVPQSLTILQEGYKASEERFIKASEEQRMKFLESNRELRADFLAATKERQVSFEKSLDQLTKTFDRAQDRSDALILRVESIRKELDETKRELDKEKAAQK